MGYVADRQKAVLNTPMWSLEEFDPEQAVNSETAGRSRDAAGRPDPDFPAHALRHRFRNAQPTHEHRRLLHNQRRGQRRRLRADPGSIASPAPGGTLSGPLADAFAPQPRGVC